MEREIKFRAWLKDGHWAIERYGQMVEDYTSTLLFESLGFWSGDEAVYLQYTGLKDKNGKEIYEGDVVELLIHKEHDYKGTGTYSVVYKAPEFCLEFISVSESLKHLFGEGKIFNDKHTSIWNSNLKNTEIIGNIYENPPSLLK